MLGETWALAGKVKAATEHYRGALDRARTLRMRPLEALCHLGLGELGRRTGDGALAKEGLTEAVRLLQAMDMRHWVVHAEAALREL